MLAAIGKRGTYMMHEEKIKAWLELGAKILETCNGVLLQAQFEEKDKTLSNPKVIALTLMCRTVNNFGALRVLIENQFVVEARTIARCCYENLFWLGGLTAKGDEFVKQMMDDHELSTIKRGNELMQWAKKQDGKLDFEGPLAAFLEKMKAQSSAKSGVVHKNAADAGKLGEGYIIYRTLSTDSAHPSIVSLSRHIGQKTEVEIEYVTIIGEPPPDSAELDETLKFGCSSLLGACVAANQIIGGTPSGQALAALFDEYITLSSDRAKQLVGR